MSITSTYLKGALKVGRHCTEKMRRTKPPRHFRVLAACGVLVLASSAFSPPVEPAMTVVIDAGHGGKDPGNLGTGRYKTAEKDITLAVAHKTAAYIEERVPGVRIVMTRSGDTYPTLPDRVRIANEAEADLLLSIHCDSFKKSSAVGSSTFVMGLGKSEASLRVASKENAAIFQENSNEAKGFDPNDPDTFIALALKQEIYLERSLQLADLIQTQFRERVGRKDRGVRQAGYYVTAYANMPSVLVELGFLTNPKEEDFLRSEQGQDYMASALFRAFRSYAETWLSLESAVEAPANSTLETPAPEGEIAPEESAESTSIAAEKPSWFNTLTNACSEGVCFTVQATSSRRGGPLMDGQGNAIPCTQSTMSGGVHKYRVGSSPSYAVACQMRDTLRLKGFPDAFVVAFEEGSRIPLEQAIKKQRN
jgi:N-acetylmuramoyl-L-alanine amidase